MTQVLINGIVNGLLLAVLATALNFVYVPTRIFHLAVGASLTVTPLLLTQLLSTGWGWGISIIVSLLASISLSCSCEIINHRPLSKKNVGAGGQLIVSLGTLLIFTQTAIMIWGSQSRLLRKGIDGVYDLTMISLTDSQFRILVTCCLLLVVTLLISKFTRVGGMMRALADNESECELRGYRISYWRIVFFAFSGLFAGIAAILSAWDLGVNPSSGISGLVPAIGAILLTRKPSFAIPIVAAIGLGITRSLISYLWSASWQDTVGFAVITVALFIRHATIKNEIERLES